MTKERLLEIVREILGTEFDLGFLLKLDQEEIETLIACIRDRLNQHSEGIPRGLPRG